MPQSYTVQAAKILIVTLLVGVLVALATACMFGCAHTPTVSAKPAKLEIEIVRQRGMGIPMMEQPWVVRRIGHVINRRTIPVLARIDCDVTFYEMRVDAAPVGGGVGERWLLLRPEDQTCSVSRIDPNDPASGALESKNSDRGLGENGEIK